MSSKVEEQKGRPNGPRVRPPSPPCHADDHIVAPAQAALHVGEQVLRAPHDLSDGQRRRELEKLAVNRSPPLSRRQWNGWANFVVGVMLSVGACP